MCVYVSVHLWGWGQEGDVHVRACVCACVFVRQGERETEREGKHCTPANAGHCQLMEKSSELQHHAITTLPLNEKHTVF